jgi:hypothetical protein
MDRGLIAAEGTLQLSVLRGAQIRSRAAGVSEPVVSVGLGWKLRNMPYLLDGLWRVALAYLFSAVTGFPVMFGRLYLRKYDGARGVWVDHGLVGCKVVTDTGVGFIVDAFQNSVELENMKYHGFGTGTTAESAAHTALVTELTTEYVSDNVRPTGSTTEGATANIYRTVGTLSPDSGGTIALREHGVFSQAATGGGVMIDRTLYAAVNLVAGSDSVQATYDLTFTSGS